MCLLGHGLIKSSHNKLVVIIKVQAMNHRILLLYSVASWKLRGGRVMDFSAQDCFFR